jgi:hypothetical protein
MKQLSGNNSSYTVVRVPEDGLDRRTAASIETPLQALTDRTDFLFDQAFGRGGDGTQGVTRIKRFADRASLIAYGASAKPGDIVEWDASNSVFRVGFGFYLFTANPTAGADDATNPLVVNVVGEGYWAWIGAGLMGIKRGLAALDDGNQANGTPTVAVTPLPANTPTVLMSELPHGVAHGLAELDTNTLVPAAQLPGLVAQAYGQINLAPTTPSHLAPPQAIGSAAPAWTAAYMGAGTAKVLRVTLFVGVISGALATMANRPTTANTAWQYTVAVIAIGIDGSGHNYVEFSFGRNSPTAQAVGADSAADSNAPGGDIGISFVIF